MKSHLISQVVLKQFANPQKEVLVHDLKMGDEEPKSTDSIAYKEVDEAIIGELEKAWSTEVENDIEAAIHSLQNGDLLTSEKHMLTIKRLLALHFMRTQVYVAMQKPEMSDAYRRRVIEQVAAQFPERRQEIEARVNAEWPKKANEAVVMSMREYIPKIEEYIKKHGLEVGVAPEGTEFILGDVPVVSADGNGNFGALNGVPITEARAVAMPLTPRHIVALKTKATSKKYRNLTAEQVKNANDKQLKLAIGEYYSKPASEDGYHVLYLNGLTDGHLRRRERLAVRYLAERGIHVTSAQINWRSGESFDVLFKRLVKLTQAQLKEHGKVILVGSSAGGSMAVNILARLHDQNLSAITLCSRLRLAELSWWDRRTLERMAYLGTPKASQAFFDSVTHCNNTAAKQLSKADKRRLILVQQWADFVVPRQTMSIPGVRIYKVSGLGHGWGIAMGVRRLPKVIKLLGL